MSAMKCDGTIQPLRKYCFHSLFLGPHWKRVQQLSQQILCNSHQALLLRLCHFSLTDGSLLIYMNQNSEMVSMLLCMSLFKIVFFFYLCTCKNDIASLNCLYFSTGLCNLKPPCYCQLKQKLPWQLTEIS